MPNLILEYLKVLIWPMLAFFAIWRFGEEISSLFKQSKLKISLFGVEIEVKAADLERVLTAPVGGSLSDRQWALLKRLANEGELKADQFSLRGGDDLVWMRPVRNAGLILTRPEGLVIEAAESIELTPLGILVTKAKFGEKPSPS